MPQLTKSTQTSLSDINMVPFIDVVLVLLIIFMITAPILQSGIEVDVPKTHTVKEITEQKLVVTIDKNQRIYLGNDPVNIHQLADKIKKQSKQLDATPSSSAPTKPFPSEPSAPSSTPSASPASPTSASSPNPSPTATMTHLPNDGVTHSASRPLRAQSAECQIPIRLGIGYLLPTRLRHVLRRFITDDFNLKRYFSYSVFFHVSLTVLLLVGILAPTFRRSLGRRRWRRRRRKSQSRRQRRHSHASHRQPHRKPSRRSHQRSQQRRAQPKASRAPKTDATKIPKFEKEKPLPPSKPSKVFEKKTPPPHERRPLRQGRPDERSHRLFRQPGPLSGGIAVQGQGGGDFAAAMPGMSKPSRAPSVRTGCKTPSTLPSVPLARAKTTRHLHHQS